MFNIEQFDQVISFGDNEAMQKKWKSFCRKIDTKTEDYGTVLQTIKEFLLKPFISAVQDKEFDEHWNAIMNTWEQGGKCNG